MKFLYYLLAGLLVVGACSSEPSSAVPAPEPQTKAEARPAAIPVKDMVTLVDLGSVTCIPCKMMAPILEELKAEYQGRAVVIFIDVFAEPEAAEPFKIMAIPTQILYDRHGKEVFRHTGFLGKKELQAALDRALGVD